MLLYSTLGTALDNNNQETLDDHEAAVDEADGELHPLGGVGEHQGDVGAISLAENPVAQTADAEKDRVDSVTSGEDVEVTAGDGDVGPGNAKKPSNIEQVESVGAPSGDDVEDTSPQNDVEPAGEKSRKQSKKNRNVKGVLGALKNKLENIQKDNGGHPNYLLLVEDNFTDLNVSGPKTKTNRKILVTAAGDLKNLFMEKNIGYNPERMLVLKEGRKLEPDYSFLDQYISAQLSQTSPITSSLVSSPGDALNASVVGLLKSLSSGRKADRKTGKKKRKKSRSTTDTSSDESSDESDTSGESKKRKRKSKKNKRRQKIRKSKKKVQESSSETSDSSSDDLVDDAETSSDEDDNDPTHGTTQNSKLTKTKPKKKTTRHPKARKEKRDILFAPKKVHTPGSPDIADTDRGKSKASKTKQKAPAEQLEIQAEKPKAPAAKPKAPAAKPKAPASKPKAPASKTKVPGEKPKAVKSKAPANKSKPQNKPNVVANKQQPTIPDPINTTEDPAQRAQAKKQFDSQSGIPAELLEARATSTDADVNKNDSLQTLPPSQKVSSWLMASGMGTGKPQQPVTRKKPDSKPIDNGKKVSKPHLLAPMVNSKDTLDDPKPGPSGQFKFGRAAQLVQASKNVAKKLFKDSLMTEDEIEEFLDMDKTPTRKKKT